VEDVIQRLRSQLQRDNPLRFIYDLLVFSPEADPQPMGFPCLSYVNIKLFKGRLFMAAHYRNHYFVERAYGNYLGLARLQRFIAEQSGVQTGPLVCVSGHAVLDDHRLPFKELLARLAEKDAA
jgi:thymidylate synthase